MINFLQQHGWNILSTLFGGGSFLAFIFERKKNNALTAQEVHRASQELSKSDQDKITTAEQTIALMEKLSSSMDKRFELMDKEMIRLKEKLNQYVQQCEKCANNKIGQ